MTVRVNTAALYEALDAKRQRLDLSWRQVSRTTDIDSAVFVRLAKGQAPGSHILAAMLVWLGYAPFWITSEDSHE